jgi:hypothetical protein
MAKKIEGYVVGDYQFAMFPPDDYPTKAVLVVTDEPLYTASEVRAILDELRDAAGHAAVNDAMIEAGIPFAPDADVMGLAVPKADHAE